MRAAEDCAATSSVSRKRSTDGSLPFLAHGSETSLPVTPAAEVSLLTPNNRMEQTGSQMSLCICSAADRRRPCCLCNRYQPPPIRCEDRRTRLSYQRPGPLTLLSEHDTGRPCRFPYEEWSSDGTVVSGVLAGVTMKHCCGFAQRSWSVGQEHVAADHPRRSRQYPDERGHTYTVRVPLAAAPLDIQRKRYQKRIKGLCGAQPPHKPCWTNAVVLVEWSGTVGTGAGERSRWSARYVH